MNQQLQIRLGQHSTAGAKSINQDFHGAIVPAQPRLTTKGIAIAIADGISSSQVSQIASETAVKGFLEDYYFTSDAWSVKKSVLKVLTAMNSWLYAQTQHSALRFNKDKGYVCTFSGIVLKSNTAHLFHCGDSRIYRFNDAGLEQLTTDHRNIVSEHQSYLSRALGVNDYVDIDYQAIAIEQNDFFILATDGVYEFVSDKQIMQALKDETDLEIVADNLVEAAIDAGSDDNLTIQIIKMEQLPTHGIDELHQQIESLPLPPPIHPRMEFDGFNIIRDIYISNRSHVYLAEDISNQNKVVLKFPSAELSDNENYLENMLMEEWIAQRIDNAHVLKAMTINRKRNYLYTVMEYIEGQNLAQWIIDHPSPDIDTVRNIVQQIAKGLQAFHRQEMVHQDLRSNNIMIDSAGTVKIIDFGATKVAGISEIEPKNQGLVGTLQFTAPEYFLGELGTNRSDLFSLGAIAYHMLSGELPYGNSISKTSTMRQQQKLSYRSLLDENKHIPGWIDYAISKAVHINPTKRYHEVSEFIYELNHPNAKYMAREKPPLAERNPVLLWQIISALLLIALIYQSID